MLLQNFISQTQFEEYAREATVIPVGIKILADTETPVSVLARLADHSPNLFLLESVEGGEKWGRYSFMGISARATITVYRDEVVQRHGMEELRLAHHGDPLAILRQLITPYNLAKIPHLPRLSSGLVGYVTYEMAHFFESRIPNTLPAEQALAEFIIPDTLLVFDNISHTLDILALAFTADDTPDKLYAQCIKEVQKLHQLIQQPLNNAPILPTQAVILPRALMAPEQFKQMVGEVIEQIKAGELIQCVVSQRFVAPAPHNLVNLYRAQRFVNPSPYLFFMKAQGRTLIGSSPETMIRMSNQIACLRPIAGTRPRGKDELSDRQLADALLQDEKERAEHMMLVDLGRNELGQVARRGGVQVTDLMVVERYSHVMHLVSNIQADIEPHYDAFDLFKATFPAGTLSGAPKIRAMETIASLEQNPRGAYGGAVGYFAFDGNMDFCICIRTAVIEHGRMTLQTGAGIVADSQPELEYQETINKAAAMSRALDLLARQVPTHPQGEKP